MAGAQHDYPYCQKPRRYRVRSRAVRFGDRRQLRPLGAADKGVGADRDAADHGRDHRLSRHDRREGRREGRRRAARPEGRCAGSHDRGGLRHRRVHDHPREEGPGDEVTWSKVQNAPATIAETQAYATTTPTAPRPPSATADHSSAARRRPPYPRLLTLIAVRTRSPRPPVYGSHLGVTSTARTSR